MFVSLWFQIWTLWLLIWWSLKIYIVVNFRARGISRGARKLIQTPTLIKKKYIPTLLIFWSDLTKYFQIFKWGGHYELFRFSQWSRSNLQMDWMCIHDRWDLIRKMVFLAQEILRNPINLETHILTFSIKISKLVWRWYFFIF